MRPPRSFALPATLLPVATRCCTRAGRRSAAEEIPTSVAGAARLVELAPRAIGRRVALRWRTGVGCDGLAQAVAVLSDGADPAQAAAWPDWRSKESLRAASQLAAVEILRPLRRLSRDF